MAFQEVSAGNTELVKWSADEKTQGTYLGDVVEGYYIELRTNVGVNDSKQYIFELDGEEKKRVAMWGSSLLDDKFSSVPLFSRVRVSFLGMVKGKKSPKPYRNFKVEFDPTDKWTGAGMQEANPSKKNEEKF